MFVSVWKRSLFNLEEDFFNKCQRWPAISPSLTFVPTVCLSLTPLLELAVWATLMWVEVRRSSAPLSLVLFPDDACHQTDVWFALCCVWFDGDVTVASAWVTTPPPLREKERKLHSGADVKKAPALSKHKVNSRTHKFPLPTSSRCSCLEKTTQKGVKAKCKGKVFFSLAGAEKKALMTDSLFAPLLSWSFFWQRIKPTDPHTPSPSPHLHLLLFPKHPPTHTHTVWNHRTNRGSWQALAHHP